MEEASDHPLEGIQIGHTSPGDVGNVSGYEHQAVHARGRGKQRVDQGRWAQGSQATPFLGHSTIDGQDPIAMIAYQPAEPPLERDRLTWVAAANDFDAASHLADDQYTEVDLVVGDSREPSRHIRVRTISLAKLLYDICIEEKGQKRTRRGFCLIRSKSASSPTSGIRRSMSLSRARPLPRRRTERRISRCSASMDRPFQIGRAHV